MLPADEANRYLLPSIGPDADDFLAPGTHVIGIPEAASDFTLADAPSVIHPTDDLAPVEDGDGKLAATPITAQASTSTAFHSSEALQIDAYDPGVATILVARDISMQQPLAMARRGGGGGKSGQSDHDGDEGRSGTLQQPSKADAGNGEIDDAHEISVTQIAEVDQDAIVIVTGYAGKVVARIQVDQDIVMHQEINVDFTFDGGPQFTVLLEQDMRIDQETAIDLGIFDIDGVLYLDLFLRDFVEIEQDTTLDVRFGDGPIGGTVEVDQDIELDQDVDIDIDIDDELEEHYSVNVTVDVRQYVDAMQDADVDITVWNDEVDIDVDATQTAIVDQDVAVTIDFAVA